MSSVIELKQITKDFFLGERVFKALKGVDLTIEKGELVAIMGASGAGKSTLMNIIGLLDNATTGTYLLSQRDVSTLSDDDRSEIRNLQIGFVFQSFFLLPRLTASENVELPLLYRGVKPETRREKALESLAKVNMDQFSHHRPNELSGGQQQRVAIARSLVGNPTVILADEPTGSLDFDTGNELMELFKQLNREAKVTIIIVTHDSDIAKQTERIIHVKDGKII